MSDRHKALAWEARWALPTAIASFAAVALLIASFVIVASLGGGGEAENLREIHGHSGSLTLSAIVQALGFALLVVPFAYIFQAALSRGERMRSQFRALVVAAPLALAVASVLSVVSANEAASDFVAGKSRATLSVREATSECRSERKDDAAGFGEEFGKGADALSHCVATEREDDAASNAVADSSLHGPSQLFQLAGILALAFAFVYCSLNAMRVGLLSKFWGSLGIALGVASVIGLFQIALLWFLYIGLLVAGWVPGGRPPAWAAGEAVPWPSPGEKMAGVEGGSDEDGEGGDADREG
jgi:formate hydrogenlyase subunit 3/multisubunit Na+/H+ antiporter MnhD subunit